jgi:FlgD Ig-like domain
MTRLSHLRRLALLGGILAVGASALLAGPGSATVVCPPGVSPGSPYCVNVQPTATTNNATNVKAKSATLNGVAGPNVTGGDPTTYFFKWGKTSSYGNQTPTGTIGSCPAGITPPSPYCTTPKTQAVSAHISNLTPCTIYHFQLFASNPDGSASGGDKAFRTGFDAPIKSVSAPGKVKAGKKFKVKFNLRYKAQSVTILIEKQNGNVVTSNRLSPVSKGKHSVKLTAPKKKGNYKLVVRARLSCGKQTIKKKLKVH